MQRIATNTAKRAAWRTRKPSAHGEAGGEGAFAAAADREAEAGSGGLRVGISVAACRLRALPPCCRCCAECCCCAERETGVVGTETDEIVLSIALALA